MSTERAIIALSRLRRQNALQLDQAITELANRIDAAADLQLALATSPEPAMLSVMPQFRDTTMPYEHALILQRANVEHAWRNVERARLRQQRTIQALQRASERLRKQRAVGKTHDMEDTSIETSLPHRTSAHVQGACATAVVTSG